MVAAAVGIIVAAVYALSLMQRSFQGALPEGADGQAAAKLEDFGFRELSVMVLMMLALIWLGVYPNTLLELCAPVVAGLGVGP